MHDALFQGPWVADQFGEASLKALADGGSLALGLDLGLILQRRYLIHQAAKDTFQRLALFQPRRLQTIQSGVQGLGEGGFQGGPVLFGFFFVGDLEHAAQR